MNAEMRALRREVRQLEVYVRLTNEEPERVIVEHPRHGQAMRVQGAKGRMCYRSDIPVWEKRWKPVGSVWGNGVPAGELDLFKWFSGEALEPPAPWQKIR